MVQKIPLTLACGDYEILRPLRDGTVEPDGIELTVLTNMDSTTRHWRFLRNREFDVAEVSSSSYILAKDQGWPFEAIPVFPHRRFRHSFIFINTKKGIKTPKDLIGRKVGVKSFQVSAIVWMRGILEDEYGVPHKQIHWFTELDEDVEFKPPPDLKLTTIPDSASIEEMLVDGEIDALMYPEFITPFLEGNPNVGRLFPDYKTDEINYYKKTGIFPIMHVVGIRKEIVERHPWVPVELAKAFENAKAVGIKRAFNPRLVPLAWYNEAWEEQEALMGPDAFQYGLTDQNRHTLETLVGYLHGHGLISRRIPLEELFLSVGQGRKRGTFKV